MAVKLTRRLSEVILGRRSVGEFDGVIEKEAITSMLPTGFKFWGQFDGLTH